MPASQLLVLLAPRRPRLAQVFFLVVAAFLIFSKVWSQQYVLWLLPLIVLARPRWGAILAWTVAEIGYFTAFYAELLGAGGKPVIPEGVFVLASTLRLVTVAVLCGLVIREILRPELDAVRQSYADDPDGGVLDGAPDAPWVSRRCAMPAWRARSVPPRPGRRAEPPDAAAETAAAPRLRLEHRRRRPGPLPERRSRAGRHRAWRRKTTASSTSSRWMPSASTGTSPAALPRRAGHPVPQQHHRGDPEAAQVLRRSPRRGRWRRPGATPPAAAG